jgi:hypothetical protein
MFISCALTGTEDNPKSGLKGYSILNDILKFPNACPFDYMHLLFEGLFKKMLDFWFNSKNSNMDYYIRNFLKKLYNFHVKFSLS